MSMRLTCPACGCVGDVEAFLVEDEAKRLAVSFAAMDPALGRAVLSYLRLFKPHSQALRLGRAVKIVSELMALVESGTVCRDERSDVRRAATPSMWAAGIEQMLASPPSGLPLANHHYLRAVVFGIADTTEAKAEARVEEQRRAGQHRPGESVVIKEDKLTNARRFAAQMVSLDKWTEAEADDYIAKAKGGRHAES
jgi:hypothetical protein